MESENPGDHFEDSPSYEDIQADDNGDHDLPAYTRAAASEKAQSEYIASLDTSAKRAWLTLKVKSSAPSPNVRPVFSSGQPITGLVQLDLESPDSIKAVLINIKGTVLASRIDQRQFLNKSTTLWDTSKGDPTGLNGEVKFSGKIQGHFIWPFSIAMPENLDLSQNQAKDLSLIMGERLPPTVLEGGWGTCITYQIEVEVKRSGFFSSDSLLHTMFTYTPRTIPGPPSSLRQQAYNEGSELLGPKVDPEGWEVLPDVVFQGTLFSILKVSFTCSLALATPLSYTRGSVIPLMLVLKSDDRQALDVLTGQNALSDRRRPFIWMRRTSRARIGVQDVGIAIAIPGQEQNRPLSIAFWSAPQEVGKNAEGNTRTLYGELSLPADLIPSFTFGRKFEMSYQVEVYPPATAGFEPTSDKELSTTQVAITSDFPSGPRPRAYRPPAYGLVLINPPSAAHHAD